MQGTTIDWALWAGAGLLALIALTLLVWALFWDRARGRKRCPKCWYPMDGVSAMLCPECGHETIHERRLLRTRRRWRWAVVAAFLGLIAYGLGITPSIRQKGWPSAIPGFVLVTVWPVSPADWVKVHLDGMVISDAALKELDDRLKEERLAEWQARWWADRVERVLRREGRWGIDAEEQVLAKLAAARVTCDLVAEPASVVLEKLGAMLGVTIRADWGSMEEMHVGPETVVSLRCVSLSGGEAMNELLEALGSDLALTLTWAADGETVVIGRYSSEMIKHDLRVVSFDLREAIMLQQGLQTKYSGSCRVIWGLMQDAGWDVCRTVRPDEWMVDGVDTRCMAVIGTVLFVHTHARDLATLRTVFDAIGRGISHPGSVIAADETGWAVAAETMRGLREAEVQPGPGLVSLGELFGIIEQATGLVVDVDWVGLRPLGLSPELAVRLYGSRMSAAQALDRAMVLIRGYAGTGPAWTVHRGMVRVGTGYGLGQYSCIRVYNLVELVDLRRSISPDPPSRWEVDEVIQEILRIMQSTIDVENWWDNGGEVSKSPDFGPCAVVSTTPTNHARIEELLTKLRDASRRSAARNGLE